MTAMDRAKVALALMRQEVDSGHTAEAAAWAQVFQAEVICVRTGHGGLSPYEHETSDDKGGDEA